ncbi:MAG TPA: glycoside hydrolase family 130 protein [Chitinophagaceae bacterium]
MKIFDSIIRFSIFILLIVASPCCKNPSQKKIAENKNDSWALVRFVKADEVNPVLIPDSTTTFFCPIRKTNIKWEAKDVFNPAAVVRHDTVFLLYRAQDKIGKPAGTSRIGLAWSIDGLRFKKNPTPVLYPDNDAEKRYEWEGGCEDPRIVEDENGIYYLSYTAYDGNKARLMIATSHDLFHWTKQGLAFANAYNGKYINEWSKSGAIICKYDNGKAIAVKISGKYWMYWGDTDIFLAFSDDLVHWTPVETNEGKPLSVIKPRARKFDSDLVESGPPAMLTGAGIVLIYNSRNVPSKGDTTLPEGTYVASQILFDKIDPSKILQRMENYFLKPDKPYEISGQVNHVCFVEGLVNYKNKWFLYYGTADSKVAAAIKE